MITQALGRINDVPIIVGKVVYQMVFLIVSIDSYDLLLKLDFLMKIGVVVDVEKGVIHVKNGSRVAVEILPFNMWSTCYKKLQK
jgi:hypothetical protein